MPPTISPAEVRTMLLARQEIALLDLREEAPFARGHPLFAAQLSAGRIEVEALDRLPRRNVTIVLYDDGEGLCEDAAARFAALDYGDIRILENGLNGWRAAGYELFEDVNSYSKAFGELVEHRRHTPFLSAPEVQALIDARADVRIMDARREDEYRAMNVPTGTNVPGAELVLRAPVLAPNPETTIIVNCAGRTRSIIGTQSLINAGLPNRITALRNGTIGWTLAGQTLESGQSRLAPAVDAEAVAIARERAREVAYRAGVRHLSSAEASIIAADATRTLYRFDVRTPEEYRAGHLPGFLNAPGGQLVQETDMRAPVRGARILLADDLGSRADMTASWLAQLGWEVYVLDGGFNGTLARGETTPRYPPIPAVETVTTAALAEGLTHGALVAIDLATSKEHARGHVPGARFVLPVELPTVLETLGDRRIVLLSGDGALAMLTAARHRDRPHLAALAGGTAAWHAEGRSLEPGMTAPLSAPRDIYKRPYEGTANSTAAMQAYLDWEYGLVDQLARDGTHGFFVI